MADKDRLLPEACEDCVVYRSEESRCHRHAVSPMEAGFGVMEPEPVVWPQVSPTDHCGAGGDRVSPVSCRLLPVEAAYTGTNRGRGASKPKYGVGRTPEWWAESGYCRPHAPYPTTERNRRVVWRGVTHRSEGCGDGFDKSKADEDARTRTR
jgi:hypothetical protein